MTATIALRAAAYSDDQPALAHLAVLDSTTPDWLRPRRLVDGRLVAASNFHTGRVIADPFKPTSVIATLLRHAATAT